MKKIIEIAVILAACIGLAAFGFVSHVDAEKQADAEKIEESGGERLAQLYEEKKARTQTPWDGEAEAEMEQAQKKSEAQQGAVDAYDVMEEAMAVRSEPGEHVVYVEEYAGSYINDKNKLVVCVTTEDLARRIEADVIGKLGGEAADIMAGNIEYKVVAHSYNKLADVQDEIGDNYEKFYPEYKEGTPEYELLTAIAGIGLSQERNVVTVEVDELSEQKIHTFHSLFGEYDCVEFEGGAPVEFASDAQ